MMMMTPGSTLSSRVMVTRCSLERRGGLLRQGKIVVVGGDTCRMSAVQNEMIRATTWAPPGRPFPSSSSSSTSSGVTNTTRRVSSSSRSSSFTVAALPPSAADNALAYGATSYVPSPLDTSALQSQLLVLGAIGVMTAYWWYVLVPGARVNLAVNKKSGKLRDYLEELKADDDRKLERFFYQKWLAKVDPETRYLLRDDKNVDDVEVTPPRTTTRLGDTEGVTRDDVVGEESLEEIIRKAKNTPDFWSGDNPVLVGTVLSIGAAALFGGGANFDH